MARPRSSSLWPKPYMSDESRKFTPRSSALCTTSIDCASSCLPYVPDIDMHPRPSAGTESELWPSWRCSIDASLSHLAEFYTTGRQVRQVPELMGPITDLSVVERHRNLIQVLMSGIFAPAFFEQEFSAVLVPFQLKSFYATPPFERYLRAEDGTIHGRVNLDAPMVSEMRLFF